MNTKVLIIGAGPSGIATAIQLKRYGIDFIIVEKDSVGGLLKNAYRVDNYPGFPNGINGAELVGLLKEHLLKWDIEVINSKIGMLDYTNDKFITKSDFGEINSDFVVIASGTKPKTANKYCEEIESRIFNEVYPIRMEEDKTIAIIGAGDAAFDYALSLSLNNKVTIYNRKNKAKCIPALYELFKKNGAIEYKTDHILDSITAPSMKLHLSFENGYETIVDYVVFAIGRVPKLDYLSVSLKNNMDSLIENSKLFLVGDVKNGNFRQASIAVGSGIEAAMKINSFLNESTT